MKERYCIRCGRRVEENEPLINGLCPECYVKYHGVFATTPLLRITICPSCGSWYHRGEWNTPLPLEEVIRKILLRESHKLFNREVSLVDAEIISGIYKVNEAQHGARIRLHLLLGESYPITLEKEIKLVIEHKLCPRCLSIAGKSHKALVQVRSTRGYLSDEEKDLVMKALSEPGIVEEVVEVKEDKHGLDIKMLSSVAARRLTTIISRETGAKITESFKPTRYQPDKGSWTGITTLSVRLPDIRKGDLVEADGEPGVVRHVDKHGFEVEKLENGEKERYKYDDYWRGRVKKPGYMVYEKEYEVIAVDKSTIYLLHEETGEIKEYPKTSGLRNVKVGDHVKRIRVKDKVYMVKE